jgi:hypothetical protein
VGVHASVPVTNQVHLRMTAGTERGVSRLIREGHDQRYLQHVNRVSWRSGMFFEKRQDLPSDL